MSQYSSKEVATICMVYNATGDTLEYVTHHDWAGVLQGSTHYPKEIPNGQWTTFAHAYISNVAELGTASSGAVVYRCKNAAGVESDWMFSWYNSASTLPGFTAYTEIREAGHFIGEELWKELEQLTRESKAESRDDRNGLLATVYIKPEPVPAYKAVLFLDGADKPDA